MRYSPLPPRGSRCSVGCRPYYEFDAVKAALYNAIYNIHLLFEHGAMAAQRRGHLLSQGVGNRTTEVGHSGRPLKDM